MSSLPIPELIPLTPIKQPESKVAFSEAAFSPSGGSSHTNQCRFPEEVEGQMRQLPARLSAREKLGQDSRGVLESREEKIPKLASSLHRLAQL